MTMGSNSLTTESAFNWVDVDFGTVTYVASSRRQILPIEENNNDDAFVSENNWEVLGIDLNTSIPDEHSRNLARIFPGVREFPHTATVYGGKCSLCSCRLLPDDAILDFYDGKFYCSRCHQCQEAAIPRDIIECWDFTLKPVSFATKKFLDSVAGHPLLNIALVNPSLFASVPQLAALRHLRRTLSILWSVVSSCSRPASRSLVSALRRRSYMLASAETIDKYSLQDLLDVQNGSLEEVLHTTITQFVMTHVTGCRSCQMWVSFCDICRDVSRPIWPFDFKQFRRCATPGCRRAMHFGCLLCRKEEGGRTAALELFRSVNCFRTEREGDDNAIESSQDASSMSPGRPRSQLTVEGVEMLPRCTACKTNLQQLRPPKQAESK